MPQQMSTKMKQQIEWCRAKVMDLLSKANSKNITVYPYEWIKK
jgi:hypothetical protein